MAKLVYAPDLGSGDASRAGSSPVRRTKPHLVSKSTQEAALFFNKNAATGPFFSVFTYFCRVLLNKI